MKSPVVLLDIDGVLNTMSDWKHEYSSRDEFEDVHQELSAEESLLRCSPLNAECVKFFNQFREENGLEVVCSSSWRKIHSKESLEKRLGFKFFDNGKPNSWRTPSSSSGFRGHEIISFIKEHEEYDREFIIFDDDSDFTPGMPFIKVNPEVGFGPKEIDLGNRLLGLFNLKESHKLSVDDYAVDYFKILQSQYLRAPTHDYGLTNFGYGSADGEPSQPLSVG